MSDPVPSNHASRYLAAAKLFDEEEFERCIELAEHHLTRLNLPRYYRMKNLLLIAAAEDDWYRAERIRLQVEQIWLTAKRMLDPDKDNEASERGLREVREALDQLKGFQEEDAPSPVHLRLLAEPDSDEEEDEEEREEEWEEDEDDDENEEEDGSDADDIDTLVQEAEEPEAVEGEPSREGDPEAA